MEVCRCFSMFLDVGLQEDSKQGFASNKRNHNPHKQEMKAINFSIAMTSGY